MAEYTAICVMKVDGFNLNPLASNGFMSMALGIRTQQNNRMVLPIVAAEVDRILFQVENIVDLPVVWI